jgi:hypothetical protein
MLTPMTNLPPVSRRKQERCDRGKLASYIYEIGMTWKCDCDRCVPERLFPGRYVIWSMRPLDDRSLGRYASGQYVAELSTHFFLIERLKGLSHEIDLDFDDMHGQFKALIWDAASYNFFGAPMIL